MIQMNKEKLRDKFRRAMRNGLSRKNLLILIMGYGDCLTPEEIAEVLDIDVTDVAAHYTAAIAQLRKAVGIEEPKEPKEPDTPGVCRFCGCTDDHACPGGCSWINEECTICSACIEKAENAGVKYD